MDVSEKEKNLPEEDGKDDKNKLEEELLEIIKVGVNDLEGEAVCAGQICAKQLKLKDKIKERLLFCRKVSEKKDDLDE